MLKQLFKRQLIAVVVVLVAFALRQALVGYLGHELPTYITFYPAVMLVALLAGTWAGVLATVESAVLTLYWILLLKATSESITQAMPLL